MALDNINTFNVPLDFYSFPSGHTTAIFSINTVFSIYNPIMTVPLLIIAFVVGLSRLYLGVHYPSDVGVGLLIGILFAFVIHLAISWTLM